MRACPRGHLGPVRPELGLDRRASGSAVLVCWGLGQGCGGCAGIWENTREEKFVQLDTKQTWGGNTDTH